VGVLYRRALPWPEGAVAKIPVGPEFVSATTLERTLVDCVRVSSNAGGISEILRGISGLGALDPDEVLRWVDLYGEANLAGRLGFVLEASDLTVEGRLFYELERRRPQARVYLEPGMRGGTLARRWNVIVPEHLRRAPREPV
jgi:predicted transcriptional regulator of viral defense system